MGNRGREYEYKRVRGKWEGGVESITAAVLRMIYFFLEGEGFNNAFIMYSVSKVFLGGGRVSGTL